MEAKISISRNNHDEIGIEIKDDKSGLRIIEVKMDLESFALAITGLSYSPAKIDFKPTQFIIDNIGKKREVKSFFVDKVSSYEKADQEEKVDFEFNKSGLAEDGWMIHGYGTSSQQPGKQHRANIYRFVEEE